jgi:hypothetical protein
VMASNGLPPPRITSAVGSTGRLGDCCAPVVSVGAGGGGPGGPDGPGGGLYVGRSVASASVLDGVAVEEATGVRVTLDKVVEAVLEVVAVEVVMVFLLEVRGGVPDDGHKSSTKLPARA